MILCCQSCGYESEFDDDDYDGTHECGWWEDDDGNWYCEDCHGYCESCDTEYPSEDLEWIPTEDRYMCHDCISQEGYQECSQCHGYARQVNMVHVRRGTPENYTNETICINCFHEAEQAGRIVVENDYTYYIVNSQATSIGGHTFQEHLHPDAWNEMMTCPDCQDYRDRICPNCMKKRAKEAEEEETTLWIYDTRAQSYHNSLHSHFKETKYRERHEHPFLYYGMEWEVLFNDSTNINTITKEFIEATHGLFVAEFDRSVSDMGNGIEFISRPLSYKKWMSEEVYKLLKAGEEVLKKYKAYSPQPDKCGIHVHMSLKFFERNTEKKVKEIKSDIDWIFQIFQSEIEKISRRKYTRYCASKAFRLKQAMEQITSGYGFNINPTVAINKGNLTTSMGSGDTHHDAIVQTPKTIEVRTFRSTTKAEDVLAIIEFCRCVAHASRNMKLKTTDTLATILNCKDSQYLQPYIEKQKVDTTKKFANKLEVKLDGNFSPR